MKNNVIQLKRGYMPRANKWVCGNCCSKMIYTTKVTQPEYQCQCGCQLWFPVKRRIFAGE